MGFIDLFINFLPAMALAIACGIIATVYRHILAYEYPFTMWWKWGNRFETRWFFKPVWGCEKCFSGQLAWWLYLVFNFPALFEPETWQFSSFAPWVISMILSGIIWLFGAVWAVSGAIYFARLFTWVYFLINEKEKQ